MKYEMVFDNLIFNSRKLIKNHKLDLYNIEGLSTVKYQYWNNHLNITLLLGLEPRFTGWKPVVLTTRR